MAASRRTVGVESARKALQMLLCFDAARPRATVADLARAAALPLSSAYRHLALLREEGLVEEDGGGLYRVTPRIHALARAADAASPLVAAAQPLLARLAAETGATAVLFRVFGDVAVAAAAVEPRRPQHLSGVSGRSFPLHRGAPCKLLLASLPATVRGAYLDRIERADPAERVLRRAREAELALIRRRGYAESHGEVDPGMWAVAAPVVEKRRAIASLWLAVPERRLDPARRAALREAALAAARALSRTLARAAVPRLDSSGARAMNRPKREG
ncbi:MAG TPA: IclR family transcriptional regulator C-terminal domain-containing protein [Alphaproteobacteria bacterium]|jgi:DNA-binding IclR family transcriptional regulator